MACLLFKVKDHVTHSLLTRNVSRHGEAQVVSFGVSVYIKEYNVGVEFKPISFEFGIVGAAEDIVNFVVKTGGLDHYCENSTFYDNFSILRGCGADNYVEMCYVNEDPSWYFFEIEAQKDELEKINNKICIEYVPEYTQTLETGRWGSLNKVMVKNPDYVKTYSMSVLEKELARAKMKMAGLTTDNYSKIDSLNEKKYVHDLKKSMSKK